MMDPAQYSVLNTHRAQYIQLLKCSKDGPCPIYFVFWTRTVLNTINYLNVVNMDPAQFSVLNTDRAQYIQLLKCSHDGPAQYSVLNTNRAQYIQLLKCSNDGPCPI